MSHAWRGREKIITRSKNIVIKGEIMESYHEFAQIYDKLIYEDIDYTKMADYIESCFKKLGTKPSLVLDLACGTGTLTDIMSKRGYDMIGVDVSCDMLNIAKSKNEDILYLCQDMRQFELYGTVDSVLCMTDSLNYILDYDDLVKVFKLVKNYLNPHAPFIFDMNSHYKLSQIIKDNTFTYDSEFVSYVWENEYDEEENICDFYLTFFVSKDGENYRRFDEAHTERAYTEDEVKRALYEAGFENVSVYDGYSFDNAHTKSERLVYTAR